MNFRPVVTSMILAAAVALPFAAQAAGQITVSGEARVAVSPDLAVLSLGATGRGQTAAEAMDATSQAVEAILARLDAEGIEARDIQTSGLMLNEQRRWDQERNTEVFEGYLSENTVRVRIRDLDRVGTILGAALDEGANRMTGLTFDLADPRTAQDAARREAVGDAMKKAALYAEAAGLPLGPVISISDTVGMPAPRAAFDAPVMEMKAASVPVAAGEMEVSASVTMVFGIGE